MQFNFYFELPCQIFFLRVALSVHVFDYFLKKIVADAIPSLKKYFNYLSSRINRFITFTLSNMFIIKTNIFEQRISSETSGLV